MRTMLCAICLLALSVLAVRAGDNVSNHAPFGLTWGVSPTEVKSLGVELTKIENRTFGESYSASKLPKVLSDVSSVFLSFGFENKLWRITAISQMIKNDPSGGRVLSRYNELLNVLTDKYGKGQTNHKLDSIYGRKSENFLMGLSTGRSHWFTSWKTERLEIEFSIGAESLSTGYWRLIMKHRLLSRGFERSKKSHEKGVL